MVDRIFLLKPQYLQISGIVKNRCFVFIFEYWMLILTPSNIKSTEYKKTLAWYNLVNTIQQINW